MKLTSERARSVSLSGIRVIWEKALRMKDVIRLEIGEPDFDTPLNIKDAAVEALKAGHTHYTPSAGVLELRKAVSEKLKRENNIDANPEDEVVITAGACAAINLAIFSTVNPGEEVLVPEPGWPHYEPDVILAGGIPVKYQAKEENGFLPDVDELKKKISKKTKMIILNSPNNPTGAVYDYRTLREIADLAAQHKMLILSDEVYEKFIFDDVKHYSIASFSEEIKNLTITVNALSKTYAMTGWRIGYAAANKEIIAQMVKLNLYMNTCANSIAQIAAIEALRGPQDEVVKMREEYKRRRDILVKGLNEIDGFKCIVPKGAFYCFPNIAEFGINSFDFSIFLLENARVSTVPGSAFGKGGEGHLRISFTNSAENIIKAIERIRRAVGKLRAR